MALLWMDGFDTYGTNGVGASDTINGAGYQNAAGLSMTNGTRTGRGLAVSMSNGAASFQSARCRRAFVTRDEIIIGQAIWLPNNNLSHICQLLYDDGLGNVYTQLHVYRNATGGITIAKADGTSGGPQMVGQSAPNIVFPHVWHYVEVKYKPGSHTVVRVDGATVLNVAGAKNNSAPNLVNLHQFANLSSEFDLNDYTKRFDDLYICDTTGALFNDFCGDVVIHAVLPNGDAGPNQMAAFGAGLANYTAVDDVPPDEDLSYLYSNTLGHKDMFTVDPLPSNIIDVLAVSVHTRVKKDAAGTSNIKVKCKYGSDEIESPGMPLTTIYTNKHHIFETAPDGGGWNKVKAVNMQIGVEIA